MEKTSEELREKYLRKDLIPSIFCPGCGIGQIMHYVVRAIDDLKIDQDNLVFVSGIGCSSRLPAYFEAYGIHTLHGRALAYATGIKVTNPDLTVIVFTGDGDLAAIGLNHFLQAIRRNVDITVICVNNETYGMTGGQVSPTTSMGARTKTTPFQNIEHSFNLSFLAKAAGAVYVSRWTTIHSRQVINSLKKGIQKKGLAFIELLSPCPTSNRRFDKPTDYLDFFQNETIKYSKACKNEFSGRVFEEIDECFTTRYQGKLIIGDITDLEKPDYHTLYNQLKERARDEFWEGREKRD